MYPMAHNKQVWDLSLLQILTTSDTINSYALALAKSRNQYMTHQLAVQLASAVRRDDKWLQVAKRVIEKDYLTAFQLCCHDDCLLQPLMTVYFSQPKSTPYYDNHSLIVYKKALAILEAPPNQLYNQLIQMRNFQLYLELSLKHKDTNIIRQLFNVFSRYCSQINNILSPISSLPDISNNTNVEDSWSFHEIAIKIFRDLVGIVGFIEPVAVRKMWVNQFDSKLTDRTKGCTIKQIIGQKIMPITQLLCTKAKTQSLRLSHTNHTILSLLGTRKLPKLTDYYSDLCYTIMTIAKITAFQCILTRNQPFLALMTELARCIDILKLNNHSNTGAQILAINDEISSHIYSDTLAGLFMCMISTLCNNIGPFFHLYLQMLHKVYTQQNLAQLKSEQFIGYLIKVILLSDEDLVFMRKQQIGKLLELINNVVAPNWAFYDQWGQLQILRYFMAFTGSLGRETGMSESAEDLILKCVTLCFSCLKSGDMEDPYHPNDLTPIQAQCQNILQNLPEQPKTLHLIKKYLLPTLLTQFTNFSNPSPSILDIFHTYMTKVPEIITRSSQYIISYLYNLFVQETLTLEQNNKQGFRIKCSQRIVKVLRILSTVLENESEVREEDIEDKIVKPILMKLCEPNTIEYEQELLGVLEIVLQKHSHFSPEICFIICKLPQIYQKNDKKLSILRNIYRALALAKHIRDQILYSYPDIVSIMLGMFVDYMQNIISVEQYLYYREEVRSLVWNFQIFLNKFGDVIIEDKMLMEMVGVRLFDSLCACMQKTIKYIDQYNKTHQSVQASNSIIYYEFQEIQTQLFFTISHLFISPESHPLNQKISSNTVKLVKVLSPNNYIYFQTVRMVPVILIDQLFIDPDGHENAVTDLVSFCQLMGQKQMQWGINKEWGKIEGVEEWDLWPIKVKQYVENVLREMRNRKTIDQVDHTQYTQALSQVLR